MSSVPTATIGPDLRAALIAMVRKRVPESEVEDIVQSTLADAIESPHAPQDSESLRRWIFGVAKNKVVDYHRRAGRETFELPENIAGKPAPHNEADLLRWAEKHLPPGEENKTTLDWMLREGEGEKLEWIADDANVPAPRVRQRVSRLRRHLKAHWQKEVALLATLGVLISILAFVLRRKEPDEIISENLPRAAEIRKQAFEKCLSNEFKDCLQKLDEAKKLDPAGDTRPEVKQARENANKGLTLPPAPSSIPTTTQNDDNNISPPPTTTPTPSPSAVPSDVKAAPKFDQKKAAPNTNKPSPRTFSTENVTPAPPSSFTPPSKMKSPSKDDSSGFEKEPSKPQGKSMSPKPSGTDDFGSSIPPATKGGGSFGGSKKEASNAPASKSLNTKRATPSKATKGGSGSDFFGSSL